MLSTFLPRDVADIRRNYIGHPLYIALRDACLDCCEAVHVYPLRPEQVFVEVLRAIDELKQVQQEVDWSTLYRNIRQDYQLQDKAIPQEELDAIASTIVCALAAVLATATPSFYSRLAMRLMEQVFVLGRVLPYKALEGLMDGIERHERQLAEWLDEYMETDDFSADAFEKYFSPSETGGTFIRFTPHATNAQRAEFQAVIRRVVEQEKKHGKAADVKTVLKSYQSEEVIVLSGTDADIYRELQTDYGLTVSRSAFFDAEPKLTGK